MEQFEGIFKSKIQQEDSSSKTPVAHAIKDFLESHKNLLSSVEAKRAATQEKNRIVSDQNLKYRNALNEKIEMEQKKHQQKRSEHLKKIKDSEGRKIKYAQQIHLKFKEQEKNMFRDRFKTYKEHQQKMQNFWSHHQLKRQHSHRSQTAVRSLYDTSLDRKKALEMKESYFGLNSKTQMLKRHAGRDHNVHRQIQERKDIIHAAHNEQIQINLNRHKEILSARETKFINDIGSHFQASEKVLATKKKQFETKLKGKLIDDETKMHTIRSNFMERAKTKSNSLASCKCKKINNVEEGITKSMFLMEKNKSSFFTQTLKKHEKVPSNEIQKQKDFLVRSQSMRSSVSYNQQNLKQKKYMIDTEKLEKEKKISDALKLKKSIEIQGNCYVRLLNVK